MTGASQEGHAQVRTALYTSLRTTYRCTKPNITEIIDNVILVQCAVLCQQSTDCDGWAYTPYQTGFGKCGIAAWGKPSTSSLIFSFFYINK